MPIEQARAEDPAGRHGGEEDSEAEHSGPPRQAVAVGQRDPDPVVRGALGEGGGEHHDPDEQRPRLAPGGRDAGLGPSWSGVVSRPLLGAPWEERAWEPRRDEQQQHGSAGEVHENAHVQEREPRTRQCGDDRSPAERRVEVRHDRARQATLDRRSLEVHGDVEDATAEADEEQTAAVPQLSAEIEPEPEAVQSLAEVEPEPLPQAPRPQVKLPSAMELLGEDEEELEVEMVTPAPSLPPEPSAALPVEPAPAPATTPETSAALPTAPVEPETVPDAQPEAAPVPVAVPPEPAPPEAETAPEAQPKPARPAKRRAQKRKEAPDDWRKGIPFLGGG